MSPKHNATRALAASLAAAAIALPSALADDQRSPDPGDAGAQVHHTATPTPAAYARRSGSRRMPASRRHPSRQHDRAHA